MRAIILAAGSGSRLHGAAGDNPKCLLQMGGSTLLARQIECLRRVGIPEVTVVAGYQGQRVAETCSEQSATVVLNDRYASTNSLYSLWLTRSQLPDGAVVLNGDVLFHPRLLSDLLSACCEDALLVEYRPRSPEAFGTEEMKVSVRGGCVLDLGKTLAWQDTDGENLGIAKFGRAGGTLLARSLEKLVARGALTAWAPRAFLEVARARPLHAIGTRGLPWIEIDFPEDYERAVEQILPLLDADSFGVPGGLPPVIAQASRVPLADWAAEPRHV
jgi:L-glutamine-phosphate cytidylyltransferase